MKRYYLAYGSNLNIEQMKWRCPTAKAIGTAEIHGYELLFKGSKTGAYLTIEKKKRSKVPVAVWEVQKEDEEALDRYEGYPRFYYKQELEMVSSGKGGAKGEKAKAFVYIMHEDRKLGIPSEFYVETCLRGYASFGFDKKILLKAIEKSRKGI